MFRREYYFVFQVKDFTKQSNIEKKFLIYIKKYLLWRLRIINYFEPFTIGENTYLVVGFFDRKRKRKKTKVFFYELYAHLKDPIYTISSFAKKKEIKIDDQIITLYKF